MHVTAEIARRLGHGFLLTPRGSIDVKGKGRMETFFVEGRAEGGPADSSKPARSIKRDRAKLGSH